MKKTVIINGIECKLKSSAAIPRIYRLKFGRDIFVDMTKLQKQISAQEKLMKELKEQAEAEGKEFDEEEIGSSLPISSLEMFENIAFLMHKHGDPSQPSDIEEWLDQFETFDIYEILPEILEMWDLENRQLSTPKKKSEK